MKRVFLSILLVAGCNSVELKSVKIAAPQSHFPVSMSEYVVVDSDVVTIEQLNMVGSFSHKVSCVTPESTADVSSAINDQVSAAGGQGIIAFRALVKATSECQDLTFEGYIVKVRGAK
jgi:hypothetical protein